MHACSWYKFNINNVIYKAAVCWGNSVALLCTLHCILIIFICSFISRHTLQCTLVSVLCRLSWTHHLCQLVEISAIPFSTLVLKFSLHSHLRLIWNVSMRCLAVTGRGSVDECSRLSHLAADFWTHYSMVILTYLLTNLWLVSSAHSVFVVHV